MPDRGLQPPAVLRDPAELQLHGADGLIDRLVGAKGPHPNRVPARVEEAILAHALEHPTHGAQRVADELILRGIQVQTRHHRLLRLEERVRKRKIKLSEEQIQVPSRSSLTTYHRTDLPHVFTTTRLAEHRSVVRRITPLSPSLQP